MYFVYRQRQFNGGVTSLTFDLNGGNVGGVTTDVVATDAIIGTNILDYGSIPVAVRTNYTLTGWAYDALGTNLVGALDNVTDDLTVYAYWVAEE